MFFTASKIFKCDVTNYNHLSFNKKLLEVSTNWHQFQLLLIKLIIY